MFDRQLDVFGDEHDIPPAHERMRLFEPVRVMPGQTGMALEDRENARGRCVPNRCAHTPDGRCPVNGCPYKYGRLLDRDKP